MTRPFSRGNANWPITESSMTTAQTDNGPLENSHWRIPFRTLPEQDEALSSEIISELIRVFRSGDYVGSDEPRATSRFEAHLAAFCRCERAVAVSSGTQALELALRAMGIGPGDEVITVSNTFVATITAILAAGARPVFVDVVPQTGLMDVGKVESAITSRTKAILPVHLYGNAVPIPGLLEIALRFKLAVVEDCAHAIGTRLLGRHAGTFGDIGCLSFYAGKNLGAPGEGGAIITRSDELAEKIKLLRNHGGYHQGEPALVGTNARIGALEAATLDIKLQYLEGWNEARRGIAAEYVKRLSGIRGIELLSTTPDTVHSYHLFVVKVGDRRLFIQRLKERGIECRVHYPIPVHRMAPFRNLSANQTPLPATEAFCSQVVSLPAHAKMTREAVAEVVENIREII